LEENISKGFKLGERLLGFPRPKRPLFSSSLFYANYISCVARDIRRRKCDIVHIFNYSQFVSVVRRHNPKVKIVLHMQCDWLAQLDYSMIEQHLREVDLIIGCSDHVTDAVRQRFPMFADRCCTIFNGCDFAEDDLETTNGAIDVEPTEKRLLFVGRVSPEKGVHVLLKAFPKIIEHCPNTTLDIVGGVAGAPYEYMVLVSDDDKVRQLAVYYDKWLHQENYQAHLQEMVPAHLASRINFAGTVPHSQTSRYYRDTDILINPSLTEAFGMSLVEAMRYQKPVVATYVGGMKEVVDEGKTGLLVEADNPDALADAIISLLKNEDLCRAMGEAGRKRSLERFTWDRIAANLLNQYRALPTIEQKVENDSPIFA
jgi:glycosyltransferase involved in cell wall biosynthesis